MVKRLIDIIFSLLLLVAFVPIFLIVGIAVVIDSRGGVFYRQQRVGKNFKPFKLWKFRTMAPGSDKAGLLTVGNKDNRITRVGRFLRRYKIDELPQLLNILSGDMSFVGPRPEVEKYTKLYSTQQQKVLSVKPGLTDYASIRYVDENEILAQSSDPEAVYIDEIMPTKLRLNLHYIDNQSLATDLQIFVSTILGILRTDYETDRLTIPRWGVLLIDLLLVTIALTIAFTLRFSFSSHLMSNWFPISAGSTILVMFFSFLIFKTYSGIIFHSGPQDATRIVKALGFGHILLLAVSLISKYFIDFSIIPISIIFIQFFIALTLLLGFRSLVKASVNEIQNLKKDRKNAIIYGAGEEGLMTSRVLAQDMGTVYNVIAFAEEAQGRERRLLQGIEIFNGKNQLERLFQIRQVDELFMADPNLDSKRRQEINDLSRRYGVDVKLTPPSKSWINGELNFRQLRPFTVEDLMDRDPIKLSPEAIGHFLKDKVVLVTGAAGSIGSEIVRQVIAFQPTRIVLVDQAETPMHDLGLHLEQHHSFRNFEIVIGDVRNEVRMRNVYKTFKPQIVFHAAAYKHVPMMEMNPCEAARTNIMGTVLTAKLAVEMNIEKYVFVSTDKAVRPTSVMGATKRVAEQYIQSLAQPQSTVFITTRFGNVLDSNGSVLKIFERQIAEGGPVTVTHPEVERYFMTIPEACQLVLEAGAMGNGGEIYVFDMGESVPIDELARKMIRLHGLTPDKDIEIIYTGLRPGEKLFEELLDEREQMLETHNKKILVARVEEIDHEVVRTRINLIGQAIQDQDNTQMIKLLKEAIPTFQHA